jgi:phospholipase A1/A2
MARFLLVLLLALPLCGAHAQATEAWQACTRIADGAARLACFDRWAQAQAAPAAPASPAAPAAQALADVSPGRGGLRLTRKEGCRSPELTPLSRFWELEGAADCGTFGLRGLRPTSVSVAGADTVNAQPSSGNPVNNVAVATSYRTNEMRLQLSVRTKVASDLLREPYADGSDSLWFAYTQQSYWQLFTPALSRPFRSTDHEPEVIYVRPVQSADPGRWRLRYAGLGLVHHSNGQSLPYSRSWNRVYLMAGAEHGDVYVLGRMWRRLQEDAATDDNPAIGDTYGRAELTVGWKPTRDHEWRLTGRHSLTRAARGSLRLEWFRTLFADDGSGPSGGLQLHTQVFTGYGDSLLDYNRRRTMFSIGLSLSDW